MNAQPADRLAQAFRDLMEQRRQDDQERRHRIAELETELSEPTERYRRQSAAVMPGSGQDLAEYYDWRHSCEQELAELRQQQEAERDTIPQTPAAKRKPSSGRRPGCHAGRHRGLGRGRQLP